ncbi:Kelch repeat-containing protein [Chondromyces apiculatus]|uniref:Peptidase S8 and S53, subtilisin, kexin, sedolisin n=1 Tax=Chondromyces apiculatus DSM 436 TaxID=1192034 RepID=A0A017T223_9BACT|nr:hypothetical protein [Chondromyces apiculatus]EYF03022.1 peptidase S8 and S53, subtilisin, kexin, sedolisin [Chondromyces apiculatus DSM 436]
MSIAIRCLCSILIAGLPLGCVVVSNGSSSSGDDTPDTDNPSPDVPDPDTDVPDEDDDPNPDPAACDPSIPSGWRSIPSSLAVGFGDEPYDRMIRVNAWTGTEALIFSYTKAVAFSPATNTWRQLSSPTAHFNGAWAWSGDTLFVDGAEDGSTEPAWYAYHPDTDTWDTFPQAPSVEYGGYSAVWSTTTHELIVWGGYEEPNTVDDPYPLSNGGAAYDPATGTWRVLGPSPLSGRGYHSAIWNGSRMIVYGGSEGEAAPLADGAAYDPVTDTWTTIATPNLVPRANARKFIGDPSGSDAIFWGGDIGPCGHCFPQEPVDGGIYDAATDSWTLIPSMDQSPLGAERSGAAVWEAAGKLWILGGSGGEDGPFGPFDDGVTYDLASGTWSTIPGGHLLGSRRGAIAVWTGCEAILYGGLDSSSSLKTDGAIYRP